MSKKGREKCQICTISQWGLLWTETFPPSMFCRNLFGSFCLNLLKSQPTIEQMDMCENITS